MFVAAGIGAYGYAIFHLMTHAFFKALLFMSAGLVIHHLGGEQDIRKMGGLKALMPRTHVAFLVGSLALAGFRSSRASGRRTASSRPRPRATTHSGVPLRRRPGRRAPHGHTFRLYFSVFRGEPSDFVKEHAHEGHGEGRVDARPRRRALGARDDRGLVVIPGVWEPFLHWIDETAEPLVPATVTEDYGTSAIAVSLALVGFFVARRAFAAGRQVVTNPGVWRVLEHKLYFDELRRAVLPAGGGVVARAPPERGRAGRRALAERDRLGDDPDRRRSGARPVRPPARAPSRSRSPSVLVVVFVAVR